MNNIRFVYSFVGACSLTFPSSTRNAPFDQTGNGYFAAWAIVYGCAMAIDLSFEQFASTVKEGQGTLMTLLVSSLVVIVSSIAPIKDDIDTGTAIFSLVLGCATMAFILIIMGLDQKNRPMRVLDHTISLSVLAICWIIMAFLVTFRSPFEVTGNGYFASWAGAITPTSYCYYYYYFSACRSADV